LQGREKYFVKTSSKLAMGTANLNFVLDPKIVCLTKLALALNQFFREKKN